MLPGTGYTALTYMSNDDRLFEVKGGILTLKGMWNPKDGLPADASKYYLTGGISTGSRKIFYRGKIEIRAKLPNVQGTWPALWMEGFNDAWPACGEIDIMEHNDRETIVWHTVHSPYTRANPSHTQGNTYPVNMNDYNIYGVIVNDDKVEFSVNGVTSFTYPRMIPTPSGQFPYVRDMFLMMNMQVQRGYAENNTSYYAEMNIDWVRYYEWK